LYEHTGRRAAWRRLVDQVVPEFVDLNTDLPLAGREEAWELVSDYRVGLAREDRDWTGAERLQRLRVDWLRRRMQSTLQKPAESWSQDQKKDVRKLAVSLEASGHILREQLNPACVDYYREALEFYALVGAIQEQSVCSFNLGHAYVEIGDLRNLDEAERWYQRSLELGSPSNALGRGQCLGQLGSVARERYKDAIIADRPAEELALYLAEAARRYEEALEAIPESAIVDRGIAHHQLGNTYMAAENIDLALYHYQQDIRCCEIAGDTYGAGQTRRNVARALLSAGRLADARAYAQAALANFLTFNDRAVVEIQASENLIAEIDKVMTDKD